MLTQLFSENLYWPLSVSLSLSLRQTKTLKNTKSFSFFSEKCNVWHNMGICFWHMPFCCPPPYIRSKKTRNATYCVAIFDVRIVYPIVVHFKILPDRPSFKQNHDRYGGIHSRWQLDRWNRIEKKDTISRKDRKERYLHEEKYIYG